MFETLSRHVLQNCMGNVSWAELAVVLLVLTTIFVPRVRRRLVDGVRAFGWGVRKGARDTDAGIVVREVAERRGDANVH